MSLKAKINDDLKVAMRAGEAFKRDTLRGLLGAIKQVEVDTRADQSDGDIEKILQKQIKQRNDSIEQFRAGGRDELAQKELDEIAIIEAYLPKQLTDEELKEILTSVIGSLAEKTMGAVMAKAKEQIGTKADGKRVSQMVKALLG